MNCHEMLKHFDAKAFQNSKIRSAGEHLVKGSGSTGTVRLKPYDLSLWDKSGRCAVMPVDNPNQSAIPFAEMTTQLNGWSCIISASMNNSSFDLAIFDCDGVLVESEPLGCQVYLQMFREYGYDLDYDETLIEFHGVALRERVEVTSRKLGWSPPADFIPVFYERLAALSERELQPVPHIHELIESLSVPICVASNGSRAEITLRLRVANLIQHFGDSIFSGIEVPHPKPEPDVFLAAASAFQVHPSRCVVIEDSVLGVTAAVRARMKVFGYASLNSPESLQAAGAIPFNSMLELKEILARESSVA